MFERTLDSLIKGLRSNRGQDEPAFVATLLEEIRHELQSGDMEVKAGAVLKLTYLRMLGYPSSHASFPILEVMASSQYHLKQVGYLAATQSFNQDTDVLILATNLIQKDLHSANPLEVAVALNGLSHIVTPELAQHLAGDIVGMMNHSRPAIRKKAVLCIYTIIQNYPPALEQSWHRLSEKLEDTDPGVVSATVNIICELSRKNPLPFLALSPQLFQLLTSSTNNWILIKLVKLFGALTPHEPRLVRKLLPPIKTLISTTPAMSLLYECIHSVINGDMLNGPGADDLAEACVEKLAAFLDDEDRNLRYIALLALVRILPTHPHLVARYQHLVLPSISDPDLSIRLRALDLAAGMASSRNLQEIVQQLVSHLDPDHAAREVQSATASLQSTLAGTSNGALSRKGSAFELAELPSYRLEVSKKILAIGASDTYANIIDFEWYLSILLRLAYTPGIKIGRDIRDQVVEITARVKEVRPFAVKQMIKLLEDDLYFSTSDIEGKELLHAAAWICGEYADYVDNPRTVIPLLLRPALNECHPSTLATSLHNGTKLFAHWAASLSEDWNGHRLEEMKNMTALVAERLSIYIRHADCEASERALETLQLLQFIEKDLEDQKPVAGELKPAPLPTKDSLAQLPLDESIERWGTASPLTSISSARGPKSLHLLAPLFQPRPLGPVVEKAQSQVAHPQSLDLWQPICSETWVNQQRKKSHAEREGVEKEGSHLFASSSKGSKGKTVAVRQGDDSNEDGVASAKRKAERIQRLKLDPYYMSESNPIASPSSRKVSGGSKDKSGKRTKKGVRDGVIISPSSPLSPPPPLADDDLDDVPIIQLSLDDLDLVGPSAASTKRTGKGEGDENKLLPSALLPGEAKASGLDVGMEAVRDETTTPEPMVVMKKLKKKKGKKKSQTVLE